MNPSHNVGDDVTFILMHSDYTTMHDGIIRSIEIGVGSNFQRKNAYWIDLGIDGLHKVFGDKILINRTKERVVECIEELVILK